MYVENANGDVLRLDPESNQVIGITIPFFSKRAQKREIEVPEVGSVPFNDLAQELVSR